MVESSSDKMHETTQTYLIVPGRHLRRTMFCGVKPSTVVRADDGGGERGRTTALGEVDRSRILLMQMGRYRARSCGERERW